DTTPPATVAVAISPTSASLQAGGTQQFTATVTGTTNTAVTWSATGGTISSSGLYTAPSTAGTYTVTATSVADSTKSASARVTVTAPPPPTGCTNTTNRTVLICSPQNGATLQTPVQITAQVNDSAAVTGVKIYVDGTSVWSGSSKDVNATLNLSAGTHRITVKAWDSAGSFSSTINITVSSSGGGGGTCTGSTTNRTVTICTPVANSTTSSPVHITAAVTDSRSVSAVKIYIDGVSKYQTMSKQIDTSLSMSAGSHRITIKAWDSAGSFSATENITLQ